MKLWQKVILGLILGVVFGALLGNVKQEGPLGFDGQDFLRMYILPLGTLFIHLIKMVVVPLIFFSLISGIVSMTDANAFKRIGTKALIAFLSTAMFAVIIGITFASVFKPGEGIDTDQLKNIAAKPSAAVAKAADPEQNPHAEEKPPVKIIIDLIVEMVPQNAINAMATDHILQVVVFAIFTAIIINSLGDRVSGVREIIHQSALIVFKMIELVIKFSPYGVFAFTAVVVGTQGMEILLALMKLAMVVFGAMVFQYLLFGLIIIFFGKLSPMPFYKKMVEVQALAFSTSSSKATLSTTMRVLTERLGVSKSSTSFVLPLGASINMDGTAIYLGICAIFFSQAYGLPLHSHEYLLIVITSTFASIGAAGIPGGSLIMMGMVLTSVGLPLEGIALIAGIDRILDMLRTTINITGDACITLVVDKTEGTMDEKTYFADV